jgi:O-antigen ligase
LFFLLFLLSIVFSSIWSINRQISLFYIIRFIELALLVWLVWSSGLDKKKILLSFILGVLIHAGLGIWQFFTQTVIGNKWLGIGAQNPVDSGVSVVETPLRRFLRAYGGLPHPNILAGWLVAGLWALVFLYQKLSARLAARIFLLIIYSLLFISLILTFSRSAWLGFALGWVVLLFWLISQHRSKPTTISVRQTAVKFLFISAILSIFLGWLLQEPLTHRVTSLTIQRSAEERQEGLLQSVNLIKKYPWTGKGIGTYSFQLHLLYPQEPVWSLQPVHNIFLLLWAELGAAGLVIVLFLYGLLLKWFYQDKNQLGLILFVSFLPLFLFDHYLWTLYAGIMLMAVAIAISLKLDTAA